MLLVAVLVGLAWRYLSPWTAAFPAALFVILYLLFRDPERDIPAVALGLVSPVDGEIIAVDKIDHCVVQGRAYRIRIRINPLGTYTARSPIEGRVMDLRSKVEEVGGDCPTNALWIETDEGDSVVLQFHEYWFGFAPRAFVGLGERLGQGQRCAYVRLAHFAEVYLAIDGKVRVEPGQVVKAGTDVIAAVPHP